LGLARKPHRQGAKPADPLLEQGRDQDTFRPFGVPRWAGYGLYALFSFLLLIPLIRRWRRSPRWQAVRLGAVCLGLACLAMAWSQSLPWWFWAPPLAVVLVAAWLGPTRDPDRERKIQRRHQARYLLNGGFFAGGRLPSSESLSAEQPLYLLIRGEHLLIAPQSGDAEVHSALPIRRVERIEVDGGRYLPIYVSEAKDPPVKETTVDRRAASTLALAFDDGNVVEFRYVGAFHKHLAETAAHAVYSVREQLLRPQPAELSQIL
jgi:hypothetical protein